MKRAVVLGALLAIGPLAIVGKAQEAAKPPAASQFGPFGAAERIADNLYVIPGAGGNTAVFVRHDGVLLVDSKLPGNGPALLDEIRKVTDKPITHIINTHMHHDHTGSNSFFPANVEIIAQENAARGMRNMPEFQSDAGKVGLPDRTFKDHMTLFSGKEAVDLYYFGPAHTNGDIFVRFRAARVLHVGDVFATKVRPLIEEKGGGSALAYPDTIKKAVQEVKDIDRVITGHGAIFSHNPKDNVLPWQDFVDYGEFTRLYVEHARAELAAGRSAEQAQSDFKPPQKFAGYILTPQLPPSVPVYPGGNFAILYKELGQ